MPLVGQGQVFHVASGVVALSSSYAKIQLVMDQSLPVDCLPGAIRLALTDRSGDTSVTWYVSADEAGDEPLTPAITSTILGQTSGKGGVALSLDTCWQASAVWVWAKTNAGTANATAHLYGRRA